MSYSNPVYSHSHQTSALDCMGSLTSYTTSQIGIFTAQMSLTHNDALGCNRGASGISLVLGQS